ncbi:MAG TPA: twin-arginine translocation signal domain-containing protein [Pirellulaceae bacterium]|nr:twin-arginine translocation signal domain-containing protein [Pirellulaceae bacterium]
MTKPVADRPTRRRFLAASTAAAAAVTLGAPAILTASKSGSRRIWQSGDHAYEMKHAWPQLPAQYTWQTTHNVAVDKDDFLYVIHEGREDQPDHPSIFVFDPDGRFVRSFGKQFQGGGHGIEVRQEGNEQFLYVAAYQQVKSFAKLTLSGETVWQQYAPMESGVYAEGEATAPQKVWGRDRFMPTNFAFLPDGGFLLADGYGAFVIHRYDRDGKWVSKFGGAGEGKGTFDTPHGVWVDARDGGEPTIVVTDRAHHTLQLFELDGTYRSTIDGFGLPANADTWQDLLVIPELFARVTLLDRDYRVVARLGDDVERVTGDKGFTIRGDESRWEQDKFVHPHDACFDSQGNLFVAEWVGSGRVTKLVRL